MCQFPRRIISINCTQRQKTHLGEHRIRNNEFNSAAAADQQLMSWATVATNDPNELKMTSIKCKLEFIPWRCTLYAATPHYLPLDGQRKTTKPRLIATNNFVISLEDTFYVVRPQHIIMQYPFGKHEHTVIGNGNAYCQ